ncbi:aldo/keto reductase [Maricaulis sp.]|uniref:aldo/keto reductase n=1 Tax=Maricaulis sp. TaxID=1486257 RepID=UPI002604BE1F|nr:aldo/keto reductase [Maricaulis sp.]
MGALQDTDAIWGAMRARQSVDTQNADGFARMLAACLDLSIAWIDHADIYDDGAVEALHGQAVTRLTAGQRQALRLVTKCGVRFASAGQPGVRLHHYRADAAYIRHQAEASLKRLAAERIDLYLLHRPDYLMQAEETARALDALRAEGKIAAYGVSNFSVRQVENLAIRTAQPLAANQIELSPLHTAALDDGTIDQARARNMAILAWSPLGGSRLFDPQDAAGRRVHDTLTRLAGSYDINDIGALALAWVRRTGAIPILGTGRIERLESQVTGLRAAADMDVQDWYEVLEAARGQRVP